MAYTAKQIEQALRESGGIFSTAAQKLGITRQAVSKRVKGSQKLQKSVDEIVEDNLDHAESNLLAGIKKGNLTAIIFFLKTKGKHRGYVARRETTGADGGPLEVKDLAAERRQAAKELEQWEKQRAKQTGG